MFSILDILSCFSKEKKYIVGVDKDYHNAIATINIEYSDEVPNETVICTLVLYPNGLVLLDYPVKLGGLVSDKFIFLIKRMIVKWKRFCKRNSNGQE